MRNLLILATALLLLQATGASCRAEGNGGPGAGELRLHRTLWVFPPAVELELGDWARGYRSLEIGLTSVMWPSADSSAGPLAPRLGVFIYPEGECEGVAIYVGAQRSSVEVGLWYVQRTHASGRSSGSGRPMAFRVGIGVVRGTNREGTAAGWPGFGAAIGLDL